jgi:septal ring factor EnvC (AmiA/AmiB activator)
MEEAIMKKVLGIIFVAMLLITTGCGKAETPQQKAQKKVTAQMDQLQKNIDNLKKSYTDRLTEMQKKFDAQIAKARKEYSESMAALKQKQDEAKKELAELKKATGAVWQKAKVKLDKTVDDLQKSYEEAKSRFK